MYGKRGLVKVGRLPDRCAIAARADTTCAGDVAGMATMLRLRRPPMRMSPTPSMVSICRRSVFVT
jgi:hypothetical protein